MTGKVPTRESVDSLAAGPSIGTPGAQMEQAELVNTIDSAVNLASGSLSSLEKREDQDSDDATFFGCISDTTVVGSASLRNSLVPHTLVSPSVQMCLRF